MKNKSRVIQVNSCKRCPYRMPMSYDRDSYCDIINRKKRDFISDVIDYRTKTFPKKCPLPLK
jgi:hypothetical protein